MVVTRRQTDTSEPRKSSKTDDVNHKNSPKTKSCYFSGSTKALMITILKVLLITIISTLAYQYYEKKYKALQDSILASAGEVIIERRQFDMPCSSDYDKERKKFQACAPKKCGRFVRDGIVNDDEVKQLLKLVKTGMSYGGSTGGASILDLHTGALSKGSQFINIYKLIESKTDPIFEEEDFVLYRNVKNRIKKEISDLFEIPVAKLYLTKPTFFSRMDTKPAQTVHDEYWHPHIDKETYGSFHYTSLLYLSDYGTDFTGGRFIFIDKDTNKTVEPRKGRLSFFTSGSENVHFVEKMESGVRYAVTVSFTCDPEQMIPDPRLPPSKPKPANAPPSRKKNS